jgi:CubicO group peptidase (beta-lactamase class C family)
MQAKNKSLTKIIVTWLLRLILVFAVLTGCIFLWAHLSTGTSLIARGILWGDSDTGDLYRFPTRAMDASPEPIEFIAEGGEIQNAIASLPISNDEIGAANMSLNEYLAYTNTTAFIVLHGDQLLYEGYFNGADRATIQTSFSATKSFTSTLVGIAIHEGFIYSLDDSITNYLPELLVGDPRFEKITIRHLIMMTSGLRWDRDDSNPFSDDFVTYYSPDLRETALNSKIVEAPGQRFTYNDYNPLLVGMILERATGMSIAEYMESRLWQPIGAEGYGSWSLDSEQSGFEKMFVGVNGRAIDLVKLGWLFLNDGRNGDKQVVPTSWVAEVTKFKTTTDNYSYRHYWWIDEKRKMYFAEGDKCQFIYVYPQAKLVLARFGIDCGGTGFSDLLPNIALWIETQFDK